VLAHQAFIDFSWKHKLKRTLQTHFPDASEKDIEAARAYVYGGAIIQDMGYFPLSNPFYSDLTHYIRSGDFIEALVKDARDLNEYAFALGALEHYCADTTGHPLATNKAVAKQFPALKAKYGDSVTYENDPTAHSRVELGFDVLKVAQREYASEEFHEQKGFKVAKDLLDRAFKETYGLELKKVLGHERLAIWFYVESIQELMPRLTRITWETKRAQILALYPDLAREKHVVLKSKLSIEDHPLSSNEAPSIVDKIVAVFIRLFSSKKALARLDIEIPTDETRKFFIHAWEETRKCYEARLKDLDERRLQLPNLNFDTGEPTKLGEYGLADDAYAKLLEQLSKSRFQGVSSSLRADILAFYSDSSVATYKAKDPKKWARTIETIKKLRRSQ
jgi:hypothetical protein